MMQRLGMGGGGRSGGGAGSKVGVGKILTLLSALLFPLWILTGGAWIVQVVGLAFCQHSQTSGSHFLQFDWFVTALTLLCLLLLPWALIARRATVGLVALLAVVTVLEILRTNVWNDARLSQGNPNGGSNIQIDSVVNNGLNTNTKRVQTVFAGFLMVSALSLLLLLGLGGLPAPSAQDAEYVENKARKAADQHTGDSYNGTGNQGGVRHAPPHNSGTASPGYNAHNQGAGGAAYNGVGQV